MFDLDEQIDHVSFMQASGMGDILEIHIVFPQCWDGQNLGSGRYRHDMTYLPRATPPKTGTGRCLKSPPNAVLDISYNFGIYVTE